MPEFERALVADHLRQCPGCAAEAGSLRHTIHLARTLGAYVPPPHLRGRLDVAVLASLGQAPEGLSWADRLRAWTAPAAAAATATAALLLALSLTDRGVAPGVEPDGAAIRVTLAEPSREDAVPPTIARVVPETSVPPSPATSSSPPASGMARESVSPVTEKRAWQPAPLIRRDSGRAPTRRMESGAAVRRAARWAEAPAVERRKPVPTAAPAPRAAEPIVTAQGLYASGRYEEAVDVLNAEFARSNGSVSDDVRERNALADSAIVECHGALRMDPANPNARKVLDEAYSTKVALLRSLAG